MTWDGADAMDIPTLFKRGGRIGAILIIAGAGLLFSPAQAADLKAFNEAVALAYQHYRGASFYLRTKNLAVATFELDDMQVAWRVVEARFSDAPPDSFAGDPAWRETLRDIGARIEKALDAAGDGDLKRVAAFVGPVRGLLATLRARNNVYVFSDCVNEANAAGEAILAFRPRPHAFDDEAWVNRLRAQAAVVAYIYAKCGKTAPEALRNDAGFNRLIEGALDEMKTVLEAIKTKNSRLLAITLGEFRSFDRILFLNYG
jgi:hypothetical protein